MKCEPINYTWSRLIIAFLVCSLSKPVFALLFQSVSKLWWAAKHLKARPNRVMCVTLLMSGFLITEVCKTVSPEITELCSRSVARTDYLSQTLSNLNDLIDLNPLNQLEIVWIMRSCSIVHAQPNNCICLRNNLSLHNQPVGKWSKADQMHLTWLFLSSHLLW